MWKRTCGVIFTSVNAPDGSTLEYTQRYMQAIERIGLQVPEFDRIFIVTGNPTVSQGIAVLRTIDWSERELVDAIRRQARHEDTARWDTIEFKLD